ncbi:MAG: corrinoid methyltransferase [Melioribacteraceae bacterium]|nr:MAG: corrinoid methyltransferase [Melioribacteraceae bacterium]
MKELLQKISYCIEFGKVDKNSPYPPDMKGEDGAYELTRSALGSGIPAEKVLNDAMLDGMRKVGEKFRAGKIYVPNVLIAAKAMSAAMGLLKPYFLSGEVKHKGTIVIGTVAGDLHDIGKNLVKMVFEGGGWNVIDLGVDVSGQKFLESISEHPEVKAVGLSALLTTTMLNMKSITEKIKLEAPDVKVLVGGAPLSEDFAYKINADFYSANPQDALEYLNSAS